MIDSLEVNVIGPKESKVVVGDFNVRHSNGEHLTWRRKPTPSPWYWSNNSFRRPGYRYWVSLPFDSLMPRIQSWTVSSVRRPHRMWSPIYHFWDHPVIAEANTFSDSFPQVECQEDRHLQIYRKTCKSSEIIQRHVHDGWDSVEVLATSTMNTT